MVATILFISANPSPAAALELDEEYRAVDEEKAHAPLGRAFDLRPALAARLDDVRHKLAEFGPVVVHFGGHTRSAGDAAPGKRDFGVPDEPEVRAEIVLLDDAGQPKPVPIEPLAELFSLAGQPIRCVVLNACNTLAQADAVAARIDGAVVGTTVPIPDAAAISFSKGFYGSLCAGDSVQKAFAAGCNNVAAERTGDPSVYVLRHRDGVDPAQIHLAGARPPPAPPPLPALPPVLLERPGAEALLQAELQTKYPRLVTVQARDGAGKTTLVTRVLTKDPGGPRVGYVALPRDLQARALLDAVAALADRPDELADTVAGDGGPGEKIAKLLPRVGDGVLFVNRLHRAVDEQTGMLQSDVREAFRAYLAYEGPTLRIVAASELNPPDLEEPWAAAPHRAPVPFGVLTEDEMTELLRRLLAARCPRVLADPGAAARLPDAARQLGGLPVAAARLVDHLALHPDLSLDRVLDEPRTHELLDDLVAAAFDDSTPEQKLVLQALAVYGRAVPPAAIDALLAPDGAVTSSQKALTELTDRGIAAHTKEGYALAELDARHALRTIDGYGAAPVKGKPTAFGTLHRRAADWLAAQAPTCTPDTLDLWAARYRLFRASGSNLDAADVLLQLGPALVLSGHYLDAARLAEDLLTEPIEIPEWEVALRSTAGSARLSMGDPAAARTHLERAAALIAAGAGVDARARWLVTEALGAARIGLGQVDEAFAAFAHELQTATDPRVRRGCLAQMAYCHYLRGEIDDAAARSKEALAKDLDQDGDGRLRSTIFDTWAEALTLAGQYGDALGKAMDGALIADDLGDPKVISENRVAMACASLLMGQLADARSAAMVALGPAPPTKDGVLDWDRVRYYPDNDLHAAAVLGVIAIRQGNVGEATLAFQGAAHKAAAALQDNAADAPARATSILARLGLSLAAQLGGPATDVSTDVVRLRADHKALAVPASQGPVLWLRRLLGALAQADTSGRFAATCALVTGAALA
jgi:tetratricopeptide (TPR) repeat protein